MSSMEEMTESFRSLFKSERLVYTALEESDRCKDFWWKCRMSDQVTRGLIDLDVPSPPSRAESDKNLGEMLNQRPPYLAVLVCLPAAEASQEAPEPIGFIILNKSFPDVAAYHMGFVPEHQNKGYGREAVNWAADYAFKWCHVQKLCINCSGFNERAAHLYKSVGFVQEGVMRSTFYLNGKWQDLIEFGMLRSEWEALRGIGPSA